MKYLNLYKNFKISIICEKYGIENYTINRDGSIDVDGNVFLGSIPHLVFKFLRKLPLKFNRVSGDFYINENKLTTLEGSPKSVSGDFYCGSNLLTTLEYAPKEVGGDFECNHNMLKTLKGGPKIVGGNFNCRYNELTSLEGAPKVGGDFNCIFNPFPQLIYDNYEYIKEIIKWQDEYNIWRGGKIDKFRFKEMMIDIKEELQ